MSAAPAVSTHGDPLAFSRSVSPPPQWAAVPVAYCTVYPSRAGLGRHRSESTGYAVRVDSIAWITAQSMPTPPTGRSALLAPHEIHVKLPN